MKCKDCGWWTRLDDKQGSCRGRSPSVSAVIIPVANQISRQMTAQIPEITMFPRTIEDSEHCGDFQPILEVIKEPI